MRGDPREFPHEIKTLTARSCNLILFPWRASQYAEGLFWGIVRTSSAPVALVVMLDTTLTPTIADIAIEAGIGNAEEMTRGRSQSVAIARNRAMSGSSDTDTPVPVISFSSYDERERERGRSESISAPCPVNGLSPTQSPQLSGGQAIRKRMSEDNSYIPSSGGGIATVDGIKQSVSIKSMLCIITGTNMCSAIFPIALRFAEKKSIEVTVLVSSDRRQFPESLIESLAAFRHAAERISNITVTILTTPSEDVDSILNHCSQRLYDLTVFGFSENGVEGIIDSIPPPISRSLRSASMSFSGPMDGTGESLNLRKIRIRHILFLLANDLCSQPAGHAPLFNFCSINVFSSFFSSFSYVFSFFYFIIFFTLRGEKAIWCP